MPTLLFMLDLEHCVELIYLGLSEMCITWMKNLNILFHIYVKNVLLINNAVNMLHNIYDKSSFIECELVYFGSNCIS